MSRIAMILTAAGLLSIQGHGAAAATELSHRVHGLVGTDGQEVAPLVPLRHFRPRVVRRNPYGFGNVSNTNADPAITPNGRFVVFAGQENLDNRRGDVTPVTDGQEDAATCDIFRTAFLSGPPLRVSDDVVDRNNDGRRDVLRARGGRLAESASSAISANGRLVAFATNGVFSRSRLSRRDTNNSGDVYLKDLRTGDVTLVSAAPRGRPATGSVPITRDDTLGCEGQTVAMSDDGRFVAFMTSARLDPARDENEFLDLYVKDLRMDRVFLASIDDQQRAGGLITIDGEDEFDLISAIDMSGDGSFVAFTTAAALDSSADFNLQPDVYVWDQGNPNSPPELASIGPDGMAPSGFFPDPPLSSNPELSRSGRFVVFESHAALVSDDTNGARDIYRRNLVRDSIIRVSVDSQRGQTASGLLQLSDSSDPSISPDGRFVAFSSTAGDLVLDDTTLVEDIFVKDLRIGAIARASLDRNDAPGSDRSFSPSLSAEGRFVAFQTTASNILRGSGGDSVALIAVTFDLPGADDIPGDPDGAASIGGSSFALRSTVDAPRDRDLFRVFLSGDSFYTFDLEGSPTGEGSLVDPLVRIFRATASGDLEEIASDDDGGIPRNAHLEFSPEQSDDYFISAEGFEDATGTYRLRTLFLGFDHLGNADTESMLFLGNPTQSQIDATFDTDWYRIDLVGGQSYRFVLEADDFSGTPLGDPFLEVLRDPGGDPLPEVLASDDNGGGGLNGLDAQLDFTAPSTGTFFVAARGVGEATGGYELSVVTLPSATTVSR